MNELYLSLGSNIGERLNFIEDAITLINSKVGTVIKKASIYETPPWGFESSPFLNTCICIKSKFSTKEILTRLQAIEKELGRKEKTKKGYESRPIDIDIIYASEGIFNTSNLVVPHPLMQERKFVLLPLLDIAKNYLHPLLHVDTETLLIQCKDDATITLFKSSN